MYMHASSKSCTVVAKSIAQKAANMDRLEEIVGEENARMLDSLSPNSRADWLRRYAAKLPRGDALSCLQKYLISADCQTRELEAQLKVIFGPDEYLSFIKLPLSEKVLKLQEMCLVAQQEGAPPASISILRSYLDHLSDIDITSSLEPRSLFHPNDFDVVVTDVKEADFLSIGAELGVMRLSQSNRNVSFDSPVRGIVFGSCQRLFVPLSVQKQNLAINVLFMFDTGSPQTYLRRDTFEALGYTESIPGEAIVTIQGRKITVFLSTAHFENVDLLGQDFMSLLGITVTIDYLNASVVLDARLTSKKSHCPMCIRAFLGYLY